MNRYRDRYRVESARLKGWDYASEGWYFVTICTVNRECLFGQVRNDHIELSEVGEMARTCWKNIPDHFQNVRLDEFVIMPNHVHGIIQIKNGDTTLVDTRHVETCHGMSLPRSIHHSKQKSKQSQRAVNQFANPRSGSVSMIINHYKSAVTRWCRKQDKRYVVWQPRFYDHIIRDEEALHRIRDYIFHNPAKWETDRERVANLWI